MKLRILALGLLLPFGISLCGQEHWKPEISMAAEARVDFTEQWIDSEVDHDASGFNGRYLNLMIDGQFNDKFKYSFRHRLNRTIENGRFFDATDWIYLTYAPNATFDISAGKQVVCIGGYEYDRAPINLYFCSEFWNNIACYQFGVSGGANLSPNDKLTFQFCQSPFNAPGMRDIYAYNLQWNGNHGPWQTIWTVNLMEYARGCYISYIALGNRLTFGNFCAEIDFMNRAASGYRRFFFGDCSVMADLSYRVTPWLKPFVKYTYDVNKTMGCDMLVMPGTELSMIGGGVETWPLLKGRNEVRVHADVCYSWGSNGNPSGVWHDKQLFVNVGLKWKFQILK